MLEKETLSLLRDALETMERGYCRLPAHAPPSVDAHGMARVLNEVARRLRDDYPFFHPLYAGQMQQPPHPIARLAYALALWTNPNNHAAVGGRASHELERLAIAGIARMIGWEEFSGRLCGGGTVANAEALWAASRRHPGKTIVASEQAHYSHARMSRVLGVPFEPVRCDRSARIDPDALAARLARGDVGTVVATLGSTASGAVDALPELLALRDRHGFRLHADASYGGYFALLDDLAADTRAAFGAISAVDSIVIDPHKRGLQPYGCSSVLFRDAADGRLFRHRSPCSVSGDANEALETGFECSRPGAAAVALWATMELLPLVRDGEFAAMLRASRAAALTLHEKIRHDPRFAVGERPDLDIVVWAVVGRTAGEASRNAGAVLAECARRDVHLSLTEMPPRCLGPRAVAFGQRADVVTCLRACLVKPEHRDWIDRIFDVVCEATNVVLRATNAGASDRHALDAAAARAARKARTAPRPD